MGENGLTYLIGLDENNLYGFSAQRLLPYGDFTFIPAKDQCDSICETFLIQSEFERNKPIKKDILQNYYIVMNKLMIHMNLLDL